MKSRKEMSLSILIPTYNYAAYSLAETLSRQAGRLSIPCEIIVADDASTDQECRRRNGLISALPQCTCLALERNVGRARIRNLLAKKASHRWLLFLDSDGMPVSDDFLTRYEAAIAEAEEGGQAVICGGIVHPASCPSPQVSLRWKYEHAAEPHHTVSERKRRPWGAFRTFNFAVRSDVFNRIQFDETFRHYGYEDVLFGLHLQEAGIEILHIDNALMNEDIEPNDVFLRKTEEALRTLKLHANKLGSSVRLHHQSQKLHRIPGVVLLLKYTFRLIQPCMKKNLTSQRPLLPLFNLYKLGYYLNL